MCKADSPMLAMLFGKSSTGGAHRKCACCYAISFSYRDMCVCDQCDLSTVKAVDTFAQKAATVPGFELQIDPRAARKHQNRDLLRKFGQKVGKKELADDIQARVIELCQGIVGPPIVLGDTAPGEVRAISEVEPIYDYALHGVKGISSEIRTELKARLGQADALAFTLTEQEVLGNKTYYTGADYRVWLAAAPWMLDSLQKTLPPRVVHLRHAALCLAQMSRWGYRLPYATWWNLQPLVVMRFTQLAYRLQYHLVQAFDMHKSARSKAAGQVHTIWGNYIHYTILHAIYDIQWIYLLVSECERVEQNNRPARGIANGCSSQKLPSVVQEILERLQVEAIVRRENAPKRACSDDRRL